MKCRICDRPAESSRIMSALGTSPICFECFFANAESPVTLHNAAREARQTGRAIPRSVKSKITCYAGNGEYLPLRAWEKRVSHQALIVFDDAEEQRIDELLDRMRSICDNQRKRPSEMVLRPKKPSLMRRIWQWVTNDPVAIA